MKYIKLNVLNETLWMYFFKWTTLVEIFEMQFLKCNFLNGIF